MARKVGQMIARGDRGWLIRVYLGAITKSGSANTTIKPQHQLLGHFVHLGSGGAQRIIFPHQPLRRHMTEAMTLLHHPGLLAPYEAVVFHQALQFPIRG